MSRFRLPKKMRSISVGLGFIAPNVFGFLAFTFVPLIFSLAMAFTNWDLRYHNQFKSAGIEFVGFDNFIRLFGDQQFWRYLGNTFFFMIGIPIGMIGSLTAALLLNKPLGRQVKHPWLVAILGIVFFLSVITLALSGAFLAATSILICGVAGLIFFGGTLGGNALYRTLFYMPHFTAGVATYILWKKLYDPLTGPVNAVLGPVLNDFGGVVRKMPDGVGLIGFLFWFLGVVLLSNWGLRILNRRWRDAEIGSGSMLLGLLILFSSVGFVSAGNLPGPWATIIVLGAFTVGFLPLLYRLWRGSRLERCALWKGSGFCFLIMVGMSVGILICAGFSLVAYDLPNMARNGLEPPGWLTDYHWAKPAIMVMGFWAAIGSNNMILYLAGLSNVPEELEEAAKIDGAGRWQSFWAVTWPHLAPVTFFIFIMSVIHGLQGGFEMAKVMTNGGPAGATTTLSYYIYTEGFETGRLGYASAISWVLFGIVLLITLFNWRVGNRYSND